jgi:hypothetical protein
LLDNAIIDFPNEFHYFRQHFINTYNNQEEISMPQFKQKKLASIFFKVKRNSVVSDGYITRQDKELQKKFFAILESVRQPHASAYLFALPNDGLDQVMTAKEFRANMALRLLIQNFLDF